MYFMVERTVWDLWPEYDFGGSAALPAEKNTDASNLMIT
jgi:hypothetical protein